MTHAARIDPFFHAGTGTWSYLVSDPATGAAAIIDPVLDFDAPAGRISTVSAARIAALAHEHGLRLEWVLETHAHADHLSAGHWLREQCGIRIAIGSGIVAVQRHFAQVFAWGEAFRADGSDFDRLLHDGECLALGELGIEALATPGHTSDSLAYRIGNDVFIGDTLFAPDVGSARCDFPGADAATLWHSIERLLALPDDTRLHLAHDYPPAGRAPRSSVSVAEMRASNIHVAGKTAADYLALRTRRDATLAVPQLLYPSLQVNIRAGRLPEPDAGDTRFLKLPLTLAGD